MSPEEPTCPPLANLFSFRDLSNALCFLVDLAFITYSPFDSIAGIESDVPVPAPSTEPPLEYSVIPTAPPSAYLLPRAFVAPENFLSASVVNDNNSLIF